MIASAGRGELPSLWSGWSVPDDSPVSDHGLVGSGNQVPGLENSAVMLSSWDNAAKEKYR